MDNSKNYNFVRNSYKYVDIYSSFQKLRADLYDEDKIYLESKNLLKVIYGILKNIGIYPSPDDKIIITIPQDSNKVIKSIFSRDINCMWRNNISRYQKKTIINNYHKIEDKIVPYIYEIIEAALNEFQDDITHVHFEIFDTSLSTLNITAFRMLDSNKVNFNFEFKSRCWKKCIQSESKIVFDFCKK